MKLSREGWLFLGIIIWIIWFLAIVWAFDTLWSYSLGYFLETPSLEIQLAVALVLAILAAIVAISSLQWLHENL
jgi:hypothetical protein